MNSAFFFLAPIVLLASCETVCFKEMKFTPSANATQSANRDERVASNVTLSGEIKWGECQDAETVRVLRRMEKEEGKARKLLTEGKISQKHYDTIYEYYLAALKRASEDAPKGGVTGNLPQPTPGAGASYDSSKARAKRLAAELLEMEDELVKVANLK